MRRFNSIAGFAKFLEGQFVNAEAARGIGLRDASAFLAARTADTLGTYQRQNTGPFAEWAELADSTKKERLDQGWTENDPEYRSGTLKFSIESASDSRTAIVGTNTPYAVEQELGDEKMPPRSFFGLSAWRYRHQVVAMMVLPMIHTLAGEKIGNKPIMTSPYGDAGLDDIPF